MRIYFLLFLLYLVNSLQGQVVTGAEQVNRYLPFLRDKKIALVVNQTSMLGQSHLVDTLLRLGVNIGAIFAPEHGFRGDHGAGVKVKSGRDESTGLPLVSLYGNHKKPTEKDLKGIGLVLFDIQDVGARFYTYISTMHYVMEACAVQQIPFVVLDRPNPHGHYIDGPVLDTAFRSFVGMHPVPVVHGMTVGEYAQMINGEGWLRDGVRCELLVIPMSGYDHSTRYSLPVRPSPNLPNDLAVALYPSICFFEGTPVSLGRGTGSPFQVIGIPLEAIRDSSGFDTSFTPVVIPGVAENPPQKGKPCYGYSLVAEGLELRDSMNRGCLDISYVCDFYRRSKDKEHFFTPFFTTLAGGNVLQAQIKSGLSPEAIREGWKPGLEAFQHIRRKYLLYADFREN